MLGQNPHLTVRNLEVSASRTDQPGELCLVSAPGLTGPSPGSPTVRANLHMALPHPLPRDPSFCARVPLLVVAVPFSWTPSPGRKREWETVKTHHSVWPPGKEGGGHHGCGVGTHMKRTPPWRVAFLWCQPPSPPKLRASSCALDRASQCQPPSWAQSHPPTQ